MAFINLQEHPFLFVLLVSGILVGMTHLFWIFVLSKIKVKSPGTKEVMRFSAYITTSCVLLSWACVFLSQAKPMISPI